MKHKLHQHIEQPSLFQDISTEQIDSIFPTDYASILQHIQNIDATNYARTRNFIKKI